MKNHNLESYGKIRFAFFQQLQKNVIFVLTEPSSAAQESVCLRQCFSNGFFV